MRSIRGFFSVEFLLVISIFISLSITLKQIMMSRCSTTQETASRATIKNIETALAMYQHDTNMYPVNDENYSTKKLVISLGAGSSTMGPPYYDFKKGEVNKYGELVSKLGCPYYYRNNHQNMYQLSLKGFNKYTLDIWSADCKILAEGLKKWQGLDKNTKTNTDRQKYICTGGGKTPLEIAKQTRIKNW